MLRVFLGLVVLLLVTLADFGQSAVAQNTLRLDDLGRFLPGRRYHEGDDSLGGRRASIRKWLDVIRKHERLESDASPHVV
jgi:hypothetical protein